MSQSTIEKNLSGTPSRNSSSSAGEFLTDYFKGEPTLKNIEGIVAPGDFSQKVIELNTVNGFESQIFPLGTPSMRTLWYVENVAVTLSALLFANGALPIPANGEVGRFQIGVNLWIGGKVYPFTLTEMSMNNMTTWEFKGGELFHGVGAEYLRRKLYLLEMISPLILSKAEQVGISFTLKATATQKLAKQMSCFLIAPTVVMTFEQEFGR